MKIGDRVKFLTETGGGTVSGFRGKDTVLVEDEDGFEIPMLISDVVVEGDDSYDGGTWQARKDEVAGQSKAAAEPAPAPSRRDSGAERPAAAPVRPAKPEEKPVNPFPTERAGGEKLNILLAFLPEDSSNMTDTGFEVYLINDSNYFVTLQWLQASGSAWKARYGGTLEPNTLEYVETLQRADIGAIERTALQMIACKRTKPFDLKPAVSVEMRFDGSRLYKAGAFRANPFFEEPALIVEAVKDDKPIRTLFTDTAALEEALMGGSRTPTPEKHRRTDVTVLDKNVIEVDLHAGALFDSTEGLSDADIHNAQRHKMEEALAKYRHRKGMRIIFIHGKGAGVLKRELMNTLREHYPACRTQDASYSQYGFGATMVIMG